MTNQKKIDPLTLNLTRFRSRVKCFCGKCEVESKYYQCMGCKRTVPWCFGGSGT